MFFIITSFNNGLFPKGTCVLHTPTLYYMKAILAESGDNRKHDPCEGCTPDMTRAILAESGEPRCHDPCQGCRRLLSPGVIEVSGFEKQIFLFQTTPAATGSPKSQNPP